MKKLIATALLITGMVSFAQDRPQHPVKREKAEMVKLTPEQRSILELKKLTLNLDLNASQQKEMGKVIADLDAKRQAGMAERKANKGKKLTADEIFARKNKMLDEQIATKERVKKILTPEQMEKWEKMRHTMKRQMAGKMRHKGPKEKE
jgi:hypothetical protein